MVLDSVDGRTDTFVAAQRGLLPHPSHTAELPKRGVEAAYRGVGRALWEHGAVVVCLCSTVLIGLSCGMVRISELSEADPSAAFLPGADPSRRAKNLNADKFLNRWQANYMVEPEAPDGDMMTPEGVRALLEIQDRLSEIRVWDSRSGRFWKQRDLCLWGTAPAKPDEPGQLGCSNYTFLNIFLCEGKGAMHGPQCHHNEPEARARLLNLTAEQIRTKALSSNTIPVAIPLSMVLDKNALQGGKSKAMKHWLNLDNTNVKHSAYQKLAGTDHWESLLRRWEKEAAKQLRNMRVPGVRVHAYGDQTFIDTLFGEVDSDIPVMVLGAVIVLWIPYILCLPRLSTRGVCSHLAVCQSACLSTTMAAAAAYGLCCICGLTFSSNFAVTLYALLALGMHHALLFGFRLHQRMGDVLGVSTECADDDASTAVSVRVEFSGWQSAFVQTVAEVGATSFAVVSASVVAYAAISMWPDPPPALRMLLLLLAVGPLLQHVAVIGIMAPTVAWSLQRELSVLGAGQEQCTLLLDGVVPVRCLSRAFSRAVRRFGLLAAVVSVLTTALVIATAAIGQEALRSKVLGDGKRSHLFKSSSDLHQYFVADETQYASTCPLNLNVLFDGGVDLRQPEVAARYLRFFERMTNDPWVVTVWNSDVYSWYHNFISFARTAKDMFPCAVELCSPVFVNEFGAPASPGTGFPLATAEGFDCYFNAWFGNVSLGNTVVGRMAAKVCDMEMLMMRSTPATRFTDGGSPYAMLNAVDDVVGGHAVKRYDPSLPHWVMLFQVPLSPMTDWVSAMDSMFTATERYAESPVRDHATVDNDVFADMRPFELIKEWDIRALWLVSAVAVAVVAVLRPLPIASTLTPMAVGIYGVVIIAFMHFQGIRFDLVTVGWVPALPLLAIDMAVTLLWPHRLSITTDAATAEFVGSVSLCAVSSVLFCSDGSPINQLNAKLMAFTGFWQSTITYFWLLPFLLTHGTEAAVRLEATDEEEEKSCCDIQEEC